MVSNPQGLQDCNVVCKGKGHSDHRPSNIKQADYIQTKTGYPKSILEFKSNPSMEFFFNSSVNLLLSSFIAL